MIKKKENIDESQIDNLLDSLIKPIEDIIKNEYIFWLEIFTEVHPYFSDESWLYNKDEISHKDLKNVENLNEFFYYIDKYAEENFISLKKSLYGTFYPIKHNNIGYNIGILAGQGVDYYCERTEIGEDFIEFNDIKNNIKQKNTDSIKNKLKELSEFIQNMIQDEVPAYAISDTTEKTLKKVLYSNKD